MIHYLKLCLLLLLLFFTSCRSSHLDDYQEEGEAIIRSLIQELKKIRTKEQLMASTNKLKLLFDRLAETMIAAETYLHSHPEVDRAVLSGPNHELSDQLRGELNRIYQFDGGRQFIEQCEQKALLRLQNFKPVTSS